MEAVPACADREGVITLRKPETPLPSICKTHPLTFSVVKVDDGFFSAISVDPVEGSLSWKVKPSTKLYYGTALMKVQCGDRGTFFKVKIFRNMPCQGVQCPPGLICDECSGNCISPTDAPAASISSEIVLNGVEKAITIPAGTLLDHIVIKHNTPGIFVMSTTPGTDNLSNVELDEGPYTTVDISYFMTGTTTLYLNAQDATVILYLR